MTLEGRIAQPIIRYGLDSILIILSATQGPATGNVCGSGQIAPLTVPLDEVPGTRSLVDGGTWPARDARVVPLPLSGAGG